MKDHIFEKAKQIAVRAKTNSENGNAGRVKVTLSSGNQNSLNDSIRTEEQAKVFMTMLKSL
jgi:hypothetical protein